MSDQPVVDLGPEEVLPVAAIKTNWAGKPVPPGEPPDTKILAWEFTSLTGQGDFTVERSWQKMLAHVGANIETFLERFEQDELREGVTVTFKLIELPKHFLENLDGD